MNILDELAKRNIIREKDISAIKDEVRQTGASLDSVLKRRGVSESDLLPLKSEYAGVPSRSLKSSKISPDTLALVPEESAEYYKFVPIGVADGVLEVGVTDPDNLEARDALNFISGKIGMPFKIFLISEDDFQMVIKMYKGISTEVGQALGELENDPDFNEGGVEIQAGKSEDDGSQGATQTTIIEDAPVTKIVATIFRYATEGNASDIHIEPLRESVRVRFRVDGVMNTSLVLPIKVHAAVVARIKVLSDMKLDEKRKPQDGRFSAKIEGRRIDFRVSTFPTYYGEKVVMRILDQQKGVKPLSEMGMTPENLARIKVAIDRPYGLILISGPTGSGKTTTLYSMLQEVDKEESNVLSLEDPIEYNVEGVSQSQVHPEIGYTFANGLRTTLRQDPDIIMVGEIRDKETAQLAIQAALTGHLVLSTIHTNTATGVIPRLIDMGVDPYLLPPTLVLVMAQRLVRTLPPGGGKKIPVEGAMKAILDRQFADLPKEFRDKIKIPTEIRGTEPTPEAPTGTRGRAAVFEMIEMNAELEAQILKNTGETEIYKTLRAKGFLTMKEDALLKVFKGEVPFEEVNKL